MAYEPNHNPTNDLDPQQVPRQGVPLSEASISSIPSNVLRYSYDRSQLRPGIVHIGVGNFFRAHEALYVEKCLHVGGQNDWGIVGIGLGDGPEKLTKARAIKAQNGLYTLTEYAPTGDVVVRVVGAMIEYIHAPSETESVLARIAAPETRIVSLTITEGGYNLDEKTKQFVTTEPSVQLDLANPSEPRTVFGYIVEGLARRKQAGRGGFTVLSCDNLRSNGKVSHTAILSFAKARDPELADRAQEQLHLRGAIAALNTAAHAGGQQ